MSVSATFRGNVAAAAYQLRETRCAESLRNGAVTFERRSVELVTARSFSPQPSCSDQAMAGLRAVALARAHVGPHHGDEGTAQPEDAGDQAGLDP